jgi:hypothetical protein
MMVIVLELLAGVARMKKLFLATTVAFTAMTASAQAADLEMERELGLIVSGVSDAWMGVQFIDGGVRGDETVFVMGGAGLLSLPLGDNLSIQNDVKYEYNQLANDAIFTTTGPRYSYQGAVHLSWRDPASGLFGAFGGMGTSNFGPVGSTNYRFVGGEAQFYADNMTFYGQGGYVDFVPDDVVPTGLDDGYFARGVFRWFFANNSRLQLEGTYLIADFNFTGTDYESFTVGGRYDFTLAGLPLIGDTALYVGYRGTFRDSCLSLYRADIDDHTIMVGSSCSFSGDLITVDRQGATLDTPDFNHSCVEGTSDSDRRLKTSVVELGMTADGIKLYSWKYKFDLVTTWVGVMAQDLETTHPEALVTGADGFYRVNYSKLGVRMMTLEQWNARNL